MGKKQKTDTERKAIVKEFLQGSAAKELAQKYDVAQGTIYNWTSMFGADVREEMEFVAFGEEASNGLSQDVFSAEYVIELEQDLSIYQDMHEAAKKEIRELRLQLEAYERILLLNLKSRWVL